MSKTKKPRCRKHEPVLPVGIDNHCDHCGVSIERVECAACSGCGVTEDTIDDCPECNGSGISGWRRVQP